MICCPQPPLPDAYGENAHWRVIVRRTPERMAQQAQAREDYEQSRRQHWTELGRTPPSLRGIGDDR